MNVKNVKQAEQNWTGAFLTGAFMKTQYDFAHTREARVHGSARVPFGLYENRMPEMYGNVPAHWHEEFELNEVREGRGILLLDGERYAVSAGDILIIPPNALVHMRSSCDEAPKVICRRL